ncbi:phosphoribosylglycinamide formyltransferase [Williamsia herbipolensis]|uniref:Phosphoribosylglycinamide formyltransferase n=1 Tax=Williamsia herbipolensis TaxID=1603258 RepID=A0AAU4K968_9NOCA|nr:phosphoribosylglycinamide formyltransferase [Williamsia herbipolensis]
MNATSPDGRPAVVVLASGTGSLLAAIIDATSAPNSPARITGVVVDRDCRAAELAGAAGIELRRCVVADHADRTAWDAALTDVVADLGADLVVTAGFMKILGRAFLDRFAGRIINSHPALLPSFPGAHAVRDALAHGVKVTGATVHLVDDGVDTGPILAQAPVMIDDTDDEISLHDRIKTVERVLLVQVIASFVTRAVVSEGRKVRFS